MSRWLERWFDRWVVEPSQVLWLLAAVAVTFAGLGFAVAQRRKRRTLSAFALGVLCGVLAGPFVARRSRGLRVLRAVVRVR